MISNDTPIDDPKDDQFGIDPFAEAIAKSIEKLSGPEGTVLAVTGPWGSGKSSAVNLVRYHLKSAEKSGRLKVIAFNPWWYSDERSITTAFFQHMYAGLGLALSETARKVILSLGKKLLNSGPVISTAVNFFTFGLGGRVAESAASVIAEQIKTDRTAEEDFKVLAEELRKQDSRFLVVIDDIDRLTPEQQLLVFRLVKSVGRLPNVIYLLVFDRDLAERLLTERYPAERHFLEKIVQAAFEVPLPDPEMLHEALLKSIVSLTGHPEGDDGVRFRNVLADVVNPLIALPRDLVKFTGNLSVGWAAIGEEIDLADLLAIEALRLFRFPVYQAIRSNKAMLCGMAESYTQPRDQSAVYDAIFLASAKTDRDKDFLRITLRRLFPRLDSVWGNTYHSSSGPIWRAKRRICDPGHFSSYFRLALGPDVLPKRLLIDLATNCADRTYVQDFFRERSKAQRKGGRSEIPIVLDDLMGSSERIPLEKTPAFLGALFEIADQLDLERDREGTRHGNLLRMHWLINALVRDRLPQSDRAKLFQDALRRASLGWAVDLASRLRSDHRPRSPDKEIPSEQRLVDEKTADELTAATLQRLRAAAENGELLNQSDLIYILYRWRDFAKDEGREVRQWVDQHLGEDSFALRIIQSATSTAWITSLGFDGMGDRVSRGVPQVQLDALESILNVTRLLEAADRIERAPRDDRDKQILARFREGVRRVEEEGQRRNSRARPETPKDGETNEDQE